MTQMADDRDSQTSDSGNYRKTIGYRLQHAARLHRTAVAKGLATLGLYPGQEQVIKHLQDHGEATIGGLATVLHVRPPTISKTIARLSAQGLVQRNLEAEDARVVRVSLTSVGAERAKALDTIWFDIEKTITEGLEDKDLRRMKKAMRRIERQLGSNLGEADDE